MDEGREGDEYLPFLSTMLKFIEYFLSLHGKPVFMRRKNSVNVFAPATISNMGSGFDIIGFPLENVGDTVQVSRNDQHSLRIGRLTGYTDLPLESDENVATFAVKQMLLRLGSGQGFDIDIHKEVKPGSGIGSSASSSVAAVFAVNELLDNPFTPYELIEFAMEGEMLASGDKHGDNVTPAMLGGITLIRSYHPFDVIRIAPPKDLYVVLLHPQIEVKTEMSRSILPEKVPLKQAIQQWGNVGGLIAGLYTSDYELIGRSMEDVVAEPVRSSLIPGYIDLKAAAMNKGALGFNISGSGPSVFAITKGRDDAQKIEEELRAVYRQENIDFNTYVSKVSSLGARVVES